MGSLPSFAAQIANGRNAENRPFAALCTNVSVADFSAIRCNGSNYRLRPIAVVTGVVAAAAQLLQTGHLSIAQLCCWS